MRRTQPTTKRKALVLILGIFLIFVSVLMIHGAKYIPVVYGLLFKKEITLKKTTSQRVNILLLGIGGGKHDGPNLTDTIIFASIDPQTQKTTLVSIPRDLWIPDLKSKINGAYAQGEDKRKGGGLVLTKAVIEKVVGQPIDYEVRIDFAGFVKAVDMVGGLDIAVDRTFDDYDYPIAGKENDSCGLSDEDIQKVATESAQSEAFPCRYEHLHFAAGANDMDGDTALKFVRSRHALGPEGTDFARSKRQEKVIQAFKAKVFSAGTFLNPIKMVSLYDVFKDSIDTDIQREEYDDFVRLAQKMQKGKIESAVIDYGDSSTNRPGLLENPEVGADPTADYGLQWVLIPRVGNGDYDEIHSYVSCAITKGNCPLPVDPTAGK